MAADGASGEQISAIRADQGGQVVQTHTDTETDIDTVPGAHTATTHLNILQYCIGTAEK